jgi:hypothetical protein
MASRKAIRAAVYAKCEGHCAYCGHAITMDQMQIDHVHPRVAGGPDDIENMVPSCRYCNNYKLFFTLEQFRQMVANQIELLRRNSMNFRTAERYGLVAPTPRDIVFFFERSQERRNGDL